MLVIQILGGVALLAAVLAVLHFFDKHCERRFTHRFFTIPAFMATGISLVLLLVGNWWRVSAMQSGGDPLNGIVIISIGALVALGLIYVNFKCTNAVYGVGGSVLQLSLFGYLAYMSIPLFILGLVLWFIKDLDVVNVRVINK